MNGVQRLKAFSTETLSSQSKAAVAMRMDQALPLVNVEFATIKIIATRLFNINNIGNILCFHWPYQARADSC